MKDPKPFSLAALSGLSFEVSCGSDSPSSTPRAHGHVAFFVDVP
jgi:hypothetical protein